MRQAIVTFDRQTQKILHANEAACELLSSTVASLREQPIEHVIPDAARIEFTPRPTVARTGAGSEIPIYAHTDRLANVDTGLPDLATVHFWPPHPSLGSLSEERYTRLETLWQLVLEPGRTNNELADAILHEATAALGMEFGLLGFLEGREVVVHHVLGDGSVAPGNRLALEDPLAHFAVPQHGPIEFLDLQQEPEARASSMVRQLNVRSMVALNFHARAQLWLLTLSARQSRSQRLRPEEMAYLRLLKDVFRQLLERAHEEEQISHLAFYDPLTDLPNRAATVNRMSEVLSSARRNGERAALFFVDIDGFKQINDVYGHPAGDAVLIEISKRMRDTLRENEFLGRIGGDEFAILFPNFQNEAQLVEVAERLVSAIEKPYANPFRLAEISASIGIAIFPDDASSREELLSHADAAMYRAKSQAESRYCWYNRQLARELEVRHEMQSGLQKASLEREFLLCYQPIVDSASGKLVAVEALLRWQHPSQGLLSPKAFMGLAQANRLSTLIDSWVIAAVFSQAKRWSTGARQPVVHINITNPTWSILDAIQLCVDQHGIDASFLAIEIAEGSVARDFELAASMASALQDRGVRVGLDGFCSIGIPLKRLAMMPFDFVKLDRDLMRGLFRDETSTKALTATIALAKTFDWKIIAEGVETDQQRRWIEGKNIDAIQGYGIGHPMTAVDFGNWLERHGR
ncbi:MAG: EAL domain-containing protein [Candidatus Eremiobacteraeota bacterium]|nr:EAL domain-containing protein [Candidatus Eremiobacteraeota bacterium]